MMKIIITKKDGSIILNHEDNTPIETYKITETIDFSLLVKELLKLEMQEKVELCGKEKISVDETEKPVIDILEKIISKYNESVDEYNNFLESLSN